MTNWNPNDPIVVGPELLAVDSPEAAVSLSEGVGGRFTSTVGETIESVQVYYRSTGGENVGPHLVEFYESGNEGSVDDAIYRDNDYPTASPSKTGTVTRRPSGDTVTADLWESLADSGPGSFYDDFLEFSAASSVTLEMDTGAYGGHGRIAAVVVRLWTPDGRTEPTSGVAGRRFRVSIVHGGDDYGTITWVIPLNTETTVTGVQQYNWGEINPVTNLPWTDDDIVGFSDGTYRVKIARLSSDPGLARLASAQISPVYEFGERRVAVGKFTSPGPDGAAAGAWDSMLIRGPDGTLDWAKADATEYAFTIRQADLGDLRPTTDVDSLLIPQPRIDGSVLPAGMAGLSFDTTVAATFESNALHGLLIEDVDVLTDRLTPIALGTAAGTSDDGQPYAEVVQTPMVTTTQQEIVTDFGGTFSGLRIIAGTTIERVEPPVGSSPAVEAAAAAESIPDGPLLVTVRRRSDDVIIAQFTIGASNIPYADDTMGLVQASTAEFDLDAGVVYYLDFSSTDSRYIIGLLAVQAGGGGTLYSEATYQGGAFAADPINGLSAATLTTTPGDFAAVLDGVLDPPTDVTVTGGTSTIDGDDFGCKVPGIPYIELAWDVTDLGVAFGYYEIQRLADANLTDWQPVARITDETVDAWRDWGGVAVGDVGWYRIRTVRTDGAASVWVYPTSLLPEILLLQDDGALLMQDDTPLLLNNAVRMPTGDGCALYFTSNERPDLNVAYNDVYDSEAIRSYTFPEADEYVVHALYGRDYQVVFHPTERRGVRFKRRLLISAIVNPSPRVGPSVADTIRDLAHAPIEYVDVRDSDGNHWQGALIVSNLDVRQPGRFHWVDVEVIETEPVPSTPDAP